MYSGASGASGANAASGSNTGSRAWPTNGLSTIGGANRQQIQGIANVGNYKAQEDWWFFIPAIIFVDTFLIFLCRFYPQTFGKPILSSSWNRKAGLSGILSDSPS